MVGSLGLTAKAAPPPVLVPAVEFLVYATRVWATDPFVVEMVPNCPSAVGESLMYQTASQVLVPTCWTVTVAVAVASEVPVQLAK